MADERELMTLSECARMLRVTEETLRNYAREGRVPSYRVGPMGMLRFDADEVLAALRKHNAERGGVEGADHA